MTTLAPPIPESPYAQPRPAQLLKHALQVALGCFCVAAVLGYVRDESIWVSLVYSESIGLLSWAAIDLGRFAWRRDPHSGWPQGWRGVALPVGGGVFGYAAGTTISDAVFGWSTWAQIGTRPRTFASTLALSAAVGALFTLYFYLRGRGAAHEARIAAAQRDATLAHLSLLQSQLEPHMLFNTLANLRVLIGVDPPRAQAMLDRLIAYLRATLSASRADAHALAAEFERIEDFLDLMQVRMGERLRMRLDLPAELRAVRVPPLLLQPLVENAIKHGLEPKTEGGRIDISARRDSAGRLELCVRDTGVGLKAPAPASGGASFGLEQVRQRLQVLYGERAELTLAAADGADGGTLARIVLPLDQSLPS